MSDFAALLGQFQQSAQTLKTTTNNKKNSQSSSEEPARKRARAEVIDADDFPPVEQIFLICPAGVQTGGPEALHQLCDQLNTTSTCTIAATMVYVVKNTGESMVEFAANAKTPVVYRNYNAPSVSYSPLVVSSQRNNSNNKSHLLLWPECWTDEMLAYLDDDDSSTPCAIWWLSVDNNTRKFKEWSRNDIVHLYQSEYAKQHLITNGAKHVIQMTEYISNPAPEPSNDDKNKTNRTIDVLYNPLKGVHYTDEILKRSSGSIQFRPIFNGRTRISPTQVRALLQRARVYIDFGPHPGMDRLPREAALAGCLVVTNTEGAAFYQEDVPLPSKYKLHGKFDPHAIHKLLKDLLENFDERTKDLDEYRTWIRGQKESMKECIDGLVDVLVTKRRVETKK